MTIWLNSASGNASHVATWPYLVASHTRIFWRLALATARFTVTLSSAGVEIPRTLQDEAEIKAWSIISPRKSVAAALTALNLNMLDAPVSGGAVKAAQGEMTVMASGSEAAFTRLKPVLDAVASNVYRISDTPGAGSTVKIIHQLLAGVHIAAAAEAMALAARAGIPLDVMYDVVTHAAGNSWMFENRMQHVVDGDYTPRSAVDIFVKDLGLVADTAKALRFPLPLASTALNMFTSASNAGYGKEDDSAVIKIFSGITLPGVMPEEPSC